MAEYSLGIVSATCHDSLKSKGIVKGSPGEGVCGEPFDRLANTSSSKSLVPIGGLHKHCIRHLVHVQQEAGAGICSAGFYVLREVEGEGDGVEDCETDLSLHVLYNGSNTFPLSILPQMLLLI